MLWGGIDADVFVFTALFESRVGKYRDVIKDFNSSEGDKIDLTGLEAATGQSFHFEGAGAFAGTLGELRYNKGILALDVDGNSVADFQIKVAGILTAGDFNL